MGLKLKPIDGVLYAHGTLVRHDGVPERVRKSTGFRVGQTGLAKVRMEQIALEVMKGTAVRTGVTVETACDKYGGRREGMGETNLLVLRQFKKEFGKRPLGSLKAREIHDWAHRGARSASTVRREITVVIAMLNWCEGYGYEVPEVELKKPPEDEGRDRWLSMGDRDRLLHAFDNEVHRALATFLFYTGARLGEARGLKWRDVGADEVVLRSRKGRSRRVRMRSVELHPNVVTALVGLPAKVKGPEDYVFTQRDGAPVSKKNFYEGWGKACERCGIEDFLPHDARHTFATLLANTGEVDLQQLADLLGHESLEMVMRYRHLVKSHRKVAIARLGKIGKLAASGSFEEGRGE